MLMTTTGDEALHLTGLRSYIISCCGLNPQLQNYDCAFSLLPAHSGNKLVFVLVSFGTPIRFTLITSCASWKIPKVFFSSEKTKTAVKS